MSRQFIKYQTTEIHPQRSVNEIQRLCEKYGARKFSMSWTDGEIESVSFVLSTEYGPLPILLRAPMKGILKIFQKNQPYGDPERQYKQAQRIAWRHMKDLTEQRLLAAFIGLESPAETFMAQVETEDGSTVGERMTEALELQGDVSKVLMLKSGG